MTFVLVLHGDLPVVTFPHMPKCIRAAVVHQLRPHAHALTPANLPRAQGEAIAVNLREMFGFRVPIISVVIGEGGSGGALAIGCANKCVWSGGK